MVHIRQDGLFGLYMLLLFLLGNVFLFENLHGVNFVGLFVLDEDHLGVGTLPNYCHQGEVLNRYVH